MSANLFVVAAPSGAGKSTLVNALNAERNDTVLSISYTTRPCRPGETDNVDYHFIDDKIFDQMTANHEFLEHAIVMSKVQNYQYGTGKAWVENQLKQGKHVILEIDWQGAQQVFKRYPHAVGIFILPPSLPILRQRLEKRGRDPAHDIEARMSVAKDEILHYGDYHHIVINDDFNQALTQLHLIFDGKAEPVGPHAREYPPKITQLLVELLA